MIRTRLIDLEERRRGARDHAARVAVYAASIASELIQDVNELLAIRYAAELHELGIDGWPADPFLESSGLLVSFLGERWDGSGLPDGLTGRRIPLGTRIIALADAFDELTMPIGGPMTVPEREALAYVENEAGRSFDPLVVRTFLRIQPIIQPVGL